MNACPATGEILPGSPGKTFDDVIHHGASRTVAQGGLFPNVFPDPEPRLYKPSNIVSKSPEMLTPSYKPLVKWLLPAVINRDKYKTASRMSYKPLESNQPNYNTVFSNPRPGYDASSMMVVSSPAIKYIKPNQSDSEQQNKNMIFTNKPGLSVMAEQPAAKTLLRRKNKNEKLPFTLGQNPQTSRFQLAPIRRRTYSPVDTIYSYSKPPSFSTYTQQNGFQQAFPSELGLDSTGPVAATDSIINDPFGNPVRVSTSLSSQMGVPPLFDSSGSSVMLSGDSRFNSQIGNVQTSTGSLYALRFRPNVESSESPGAIMKPDWSNFPYEQNLYVPFQSKSKLISGFRDVLPKEQTS